MVVKKARPIPQGVPGQQQSNTNKLRKGDMARAVIVRVRKQMLRPDGRYIRFDDSACVLLNNKGEMLGSRINGPVSAALRDVQGDQPGGRWAKILAVAPKVSSNCFEFICAVLTPPGHLSYCICTVPMYSSSFSSTPTQHYISIAWYLRRASRNVYSNLTVSRIKTGAERRINRRIRRIEPSGPYDAEEKMTAYHSRFHIRGEDYTRLRRRPRKYHHDDQLEGD